VLADTAAGGATSPTATLSGSATTVTVPAGATPEMTEFLQNRATLAASMTSLINQNPNGVSTGQALTQFQQQNAALLNRQTQLAQIIGTQQSTIPPPIPPPLQIPPNASPQLQAFLTTRDQLTRSQIALINQHLSDDPATQSAAMQQWEQQNAALIQQMQQQAQALSTAN
jgi:hypothetical protein